MEDLKIRRAETGDADRLGACFDAAYARYAACLDDLPAMAADCAGDIARHEVWVAETGSEIVGGLVLALGNGFMMLANVAVHPDHRGAGIGRRLLRLAETQTLRRGLIEMRLNTHAAMVETIDLYTRNGWLPAGRMGNKVAMIKRLSG